MAKKVGLFDKYEVSTVGKLFGLFIAYQAAKAAVNTGMGSHPAADKAKKPAKKQGR